MSCAGSSFLVSGKVMNGLVGLVWTFTIITRANRNIVESRNLVLNTSGCTHDCQFAFNLILLLQ
eukprot:1299515-Pyramimonas_sp.AAC.1